MNSPKIVGIIGYSKFSNLLATLISQFDNTIKIKYSSRSQPLDNKLIYSLEEVCSSDILIPSVPIKFFDSTIKQIKPILGKNTTILEVCSIKIHPKQVLQDSDLLERSIVSHPNFGPESYKLNNNQATEFNWIVDPTSQNTQYFDWFVRMLEFHKINMKFLDANSHDEQVGVPHFISMYMGILLGKLNIAESDFMAVSTKKMFELTRGVGDDFGILHDMLRYNPYCRIYLEKIENSALSIKNNLVI